MSVNFESLAAASIELGNQSIIMPIDEGRLAVAFAELPDRPHVVHRLINELFNNENMHVRRIAVNACRRSKAFEVAGLKEALTEMLADPKAWVRYDVVWAIQDAGYDSLEIRKRLAVIAENSSPDDQELVRKNPGNAELQAKVRARKLLDTLAESSLRW